MHVYVYPQKTSFLSNDQRKQTKFSSISQTDRDEVKGNGQITLKANKSSHPWKRLFSRYKYAHNNFLNYGSFKVLSFL